MGEAKRRRAAAVAEVCGIVVACGDDDFAHLYADTIRRFAASGGGDCCHCCKRPLVSLEKTIFGTDRGGRPVVVGFCCADQLTASFGMGLYVAYGEDPERIASAGRTVALAAVKPQGNG